MAGFRALMGRPKGHVAKPTHRLVRRVEAVAPGDGQNHVEPRRKTRSRRGNNRTKIGFCGYASKKGSWTLWLSLLACVAWEPKLWQFTWLLGGLFPYCTSHYPPHANQVAPQWNPSVTRNFWLFSTSFVPHLWLFTTRPFSLPDWMAQKSDHTFSICR